MHINQAIEGVHFKAELSNIVFFFFFFIVCIGRKEDKSQLQGYLYGVDLDLS